jgi:predicted nucleic acid-binding protein
MTVVIADSSPLNYLTLIGSVDVLRQLYGTVVVPQQVITELTDPAAPHVVRGWALNLPDWVDVRVAVVNDTSMLHLDPGERAAITLAQSEPGALLLIDEAAGRIEAWHSEYRDARCSTRSGAEGTPGSADRSPAAR